MTTSPTTHPEPHPARKGRVRALLRRFGRDSRGITAVEFGFIGGPFVMIIAATMEVAMMFWTTQILEEAVVQSGRSLLTGESKALYPAAAGAAANTAAFKSAVCAQTSGMVDCDKLFIDVRSYASFNAAGTGTGASSPVDGGALDTSQFGYNPTGPNQIVVVRAVLDYKLFFTQWSSALANIGGGRRGIVASTTFRSEPYL